MRVSPVATALCLSLLPAAAGIAADSAAARGGPVVAAAQAAPVPADAAAKHAKRTACLKDAKSKKLVGADKTAFIKRCVDAP